MSSLLLGHSGFNWCFSFVPVFQWCCFTPGFSRCHNTFLSSPHLLFIKGLIRDLFVPCVGSLMG